MYGCRPTTKKRRYAICVAAIRPKSEWTPFPELILKGKVDQVAPASGSQFALLPPDNATGNFTKIVQRVPVKIVLDPGQANEAQLRPGLSVIAAVRTNGGGN